MELAAIASAAVPGLAPTGVAGAPDDAADFESALLVDDAGKQWRVRSPKHPEASMRLETELQALRAFSPALKAELPFLIPHIAGSVRQGELSTFVYSHLTGSARSLEALAAGGRAMAEEIGRIIAAVHDLPKDMVQKADLPSYEANEYRQRKLNELDQAATTGRIPPVLLRRWEHALEDVALWRFTPAVVHGDLHEDQLLIAAGRVSAVIGWTDLSVGDPAADFAWLAATEDSAFVDAVYTAYSEARATAPDPHLARRAALGAEFALAQWLVRGVALDDELMIAEADHMLATLRSDVETIEREQAAAAERSRLALEEREEWGDDAGDGSNSWDARDSWEDDDVAGSRMDLPEEDTSAITDDGAPVDGMKDQSDDGPGDPDHGDRDGTQHGSRSDRSSSHGSHVYEHRAVDGEDRRPQDRPTAIGSGDRSHEVHGARGSGTPENRSGSSRAYARLVAGRPTASSNGEERRDDGDASPALASPSARSRSANVTLLRGGDQHAGSPDDVSTSALPVISYGS